jgi:hemolysin D
VSTPGGNLEQGQKNADASPGVVKNALGRLGATLKRRPATEDPMAPTLLEFQWPSSAILNAKAPLLARGMIWLISSMLALSMLAAALIPVDQVVSARGIVVSTSPLILMQPLDTAIVRSIDVREGEKVRAGQILARLDPTFAKADLTSLAGQAASAEAEVARLRAEAEGKTFVYSGPDQHWAIQVEIFSHRKAEFQAKVDNFKKRLEEASSIVSRSESDASGYRQRLVVAQNIEKARKKLEAMKYGSPMETWVATDNRAEMERALANAERTADSARREQEAISAEMDTFVRGWQGDVSQKLSESRKKASDFREQLNKAQLRSELTELKSDVDAVVQSIARVSVGSILQSGERLMTLVPLNAPLEIEANVMGRDSGHVHVHDPAIIKFDTFAFSQYGYAEGTVKTVSPDSFTAQSEARNPTGAAPMSGATHDAFYRTRISLDRLLLHDLPRAFNPVPGMPVTVDIKVGKQTVLKYLVGMIVPVVQEGMREP